MPGGPYRVGRPEHNPGDPLPGSPRMAIGRTSFLARTARLIIASGRSSAGRWSPLHTEKTGQPRIPDEADRAAGSNLGVVSYLLERPRPPVASDSGRKSARKVHRMFGPPPPAASRRGRRPIATHPVAGRPLADLSAPRSRTPPNRRRLRLGWSGGRSRCPRRARPFPPSTPYCGKNPPRQGVRVSPRSTRDASRR